MSSKQRIGIYSGTFDPIHLGHIAFAKQAMHDCGLERVVFLPEPKPRGKQHATGVAHRVAMVSLAIRDEPGFDVLRLTSAHFSVRDTLPELQQKFEDTQLTFLMGSDTAKSLRYWSDIKTLLQSTSIAIGLREGDEPIEVANVMERLSQEQGVHACYTLVSAPNADMSSSKVRSEITNAVHLPADALAYIQQHRLYAPLSLEL